MNAYTVKSGDNLSAIAKKNGLTLAQLIALNPQFASNPNLIRPGQTIALSGGGAQTEPTAKTQAEVDAEYLAAAKAHPVLAGNSPEALAYASSTGDVSGLVNGQGQPFSAADQAQATASATEALAPFYKAQETKDTQDTESILSSKQADYGQYLADQSMKFQTEKTTQDQAAADHGVLFSGGRAQKLAQLGDTYKRNDAYKLQSVGADIGNTARDFGYKYGDPAASSLSKYYSLGSNTYNPNVATGGVGSGGLSSIYSPTQGFQGTMKNTASAEIAKRAAALLGNKANKLVGTGYNNQL